MTLRELVAVAYGNLAMAHYAVERGAQSYSRTAYMIRARLTKGLKSGAMSVGSMFDDETWKLTSGGRCSYCGAEEALVLDHLIPKHLGGLDTGDNLVPACRTCNGSKGAKDVLVWCRDRGVFPPLMILRRYLKIMVKEVEAAGAMDATLDSNEVRRLPFAIEELPTSRFPPPSSLRF
ncbi:HNH endonuclease signature motif containing protein [Schaalia hyovaginalis]|uniref:HNH endonuclease n=2 Tax=Schaalia hyovaginalis TaxID=29316 RepID=UPI0012B37540|nr:HNH endonuclease [Schaalia hyovaginalis]MST64151.1 HNH endonuclease [Schaalia hyovaginalis]